MQIMESHYVLSAAIHYYRYPLGRVRVKDGKVVFAYAHRDRLFDIRRWEEPPHVALANLLPETQALARFVKAYGSVSDRSYGGDAYTTIAETQRFQSELRNAWKGKIEVLELMLVNLPVWLEVGKAGLSVKLREAQSLLWTLIRLLFLQDYFSGRAKICANPNCKTPYFLAVRKGQRFCTHKCAVLINVHHFREREAQQRDVNRKLGVDVRMNEKIRQSIEHFLNLPVKEQEARDWRKWVSQDAAVSLDYLNLAVAQGRRGVQGSLKLRKGLPEILSKFEKGK